MNKLKITLFLLITIFCITLNAQENTEERLNRVENIVTRLPRISPNINLRYRYDDVDGPNGFDVRRARLDVRGNVITSLEYRIHLDFANEAKVLDANINWRIRPNLALMAGQYKIPFSLENPYNPNALEMIENSLVISRLVNYSDVSGISANGRDVGISLNGSFLQREGFSLINYYFGIFNGSGINRANADDNKAKDFSGILSLNPTRHLTFAFSHYNGKLGNDDNKRNRVRNGIGVKYDDNRLLVRSEYIRGKTIDLKSDGAYAVFGYYLHPQIQAVARYDYFKRNLDNDDTKLQDYTVGLNYFPVNHVRLHLNYIYKTAHADESHHLITQLWIRF